eukprot:403363515
MQNQQDRFPQQQQHLNFSNRTQGFIIGFNNHSTEQRLNTDQQTGASHQQSRQNQIENAGSQNFNPNQGMLSQAVPPVAYGFQSLQQMPVPFHSQDLNAQNYHGNLQGMNQANSASKKRREYDGKGDGSQMFICNKCKTQFSQ